MTLPGIIALLSYLTGLGVLTLMHESGYHHDHKIYSKARRNEYWAHGLLIVVIVLAFAAGALSAFEWSDAWNT